MIDIEFRKFVFSDVHFVVALCFFESCQYIRPCQISQAGGRNTKSISVESTDLPKPNKVYTTNRMGIL